MKYRVVYTGVGPLPYTVQVEWSLEEKQEHMELHGKPEDSWTLIAKEETLKSSCDAIKAHSGLNQVVVLEVETQW